MTLQEIKSLHAFTSWATNRILDAVADLPSELYVKDMKSSFGSIHGTLVHMVAAEKVWLSRMSGDPKATLSPPSEFPTLGEVRSQWEKNGFEMARFLGTMTDRTLRETFTVVTPRGQTFTHTHWQAIQHVVDHSTYHRGQVVTLMRQQGITPPNTGLITFYREISPRT